MSIKRENLASWLAAVIFFVAAFWSGPLSFTDYLARIPGDLGDARLNAYFLENTYQFIFGELDSLWHFGFFYPYPYVLGFSDNLWGLSPIFMLLREIGYDPYTSFQYWYLSGYLFNYLACLYMLRKLNISTWASILGALIFAFALPVTAHAYHAQLQHRFAIPLAMLCFFQFLETKETKHLVSCYFWVVWQFFIGIYMGFFAALLILVMALIYLGIPYARDRVPVGSIADQMRERFQSLATSKRSKYIGLFLALSGAMVFLFYPYLRVKALYGFTREWSEVLGMLPRIYSYIFAPNSELWGFKIEFFKRLPLWWEHQMFPGMVPFVLSIVSLIVGFRGNSSLPFRLFSLGFFALFCLTLSTGGSWWEYLHALPLFSAIRAVTRIDMLYLLIFAFLSSYILDRLLVNRSILASICLVLSAAFVYESSQMKIYWNYKSQWIKLEREMASRIPPETGSDAVLFFAQKTKPEFEHEISAMWVALKKGMKTLNGYSGNGPHGYRYTYGQDCSEVQRRVDAYQGFARSSGLVPWSESQIKRIVPIGFKNCPVR